MPIELNRVRAICFDIDGTLSDSDDLWVARLEKKLFHLRGLVRQDLHALSRRIVMGIESPGNWLYSVLDRLHLDAAALKALGLLSRPKNSAHSQSLMIAGVPETLQYFASRYPLAVVSARGEGSTLAFLNQFGLAPFFKIIVTAQTCRYTKPFPDPILYAAHQMQVKPQECLMVGDTVVDIRAGQRAGAQTVGLLCGFGTEMELQRAGAGLILPAPLDLLKLWT